MPGEYPLDDATLERVGLALGEHIRSAGGAASGARASFDWARHARIRAAHCEVIARGLSAAGAEPVSAGVLTTPGVAWLVQHEGFAAGVVISASHNPYHDNGVKLISSTGMKFPDAAEAEIERMIFASSDALKAASASAACADNEQIDDDYLAGLREAVLPGAKFAGMKIVMDCANGAASKLAPRLFRSLGADVVAMNDAPDGRNINAGLRVAASGSDAKKRGGNGRGAGSGV